VPSIALCTNVYEEKFSEGIQQHSYIVRMWYLPDFVGQAVVQEL